MEADPLYHIKQLFYQSSYEAVIAESSGQQLTPSDDKVTLWHATYVARSHIALSPPAINEAKSVLAPFLALDPSPPAARAVAALIAYLEGDDELSKHVDEVRDLVLEIEGEDDEIEERIVRVVAGTVFILEKETEEAIATLTEGVARADLECSALLVQLLLSQDRRDLAQGAYQSAKKIGNDSTLVQAIEAWIGLKTGSRPLHQAFYFYEELYQLPAGRTPSILASHAAAHLLLGHVDEAKADIAEAHEKTGGATDRSVLAVATSLGVDEANKFASTSHPFALDLMAKSKLFDEVAANYGVAI